MILVAIHHGCTRPITKIVFVGTFKVKVRICSYLSSLLEKSGIVLEYALKSPEKVCSLYCAPCARAGRNMHPLEDPGVSME